MKQTSFRANISGVGTNRLIINGVKNLNTAVHSVIPDRIVAGTFIVAALVTKGKLKINSGAYSLNSQGGIGIQSGGGLSLNITDSVNESIFGVLPSLTLDYAKKTTATLGKIGIECTDNLVSGGIELNLGLAGLGGSVLIK